MSPEGSPLLHMHKHGAVCNADTQHELPPNARCNDKKPWTMLTPSLTQQLTVVTQVTQQLTVVTQVMQQLTVMTQVVAAAMRQLISLANVMLTLSSSGQPGSWDQDKPTDAKIDSVCKVPQKSNQKCILTKHAHNNTKQAAASALNGMLPVFQVLFVSLLTCLSTLRDSQVACIGHRCSASSDQHCVLCSAPEASQLRQAQAAH